MLWQNNKEYYFTLNTGEEYNTEIAKGKTQSKWASFTKSINVPAKASVFFMLCTVISRAGALIFTPFFTRLLSEEEYGAYSLFNSILSVFLFFSTLEICGAVLWRGLQKYQKRRGVFIFHTLLLFFLLFGICALAYLLFMRILSVKELFGGQNILLLLSALSFSVINLYLSFLKFLYKYKLPIIISSVNGLLTPLLSLIILASINGNVNRSAVKILDALLVSFAISIPIAVYILFSLSKKNNQKIRDVSRSELRTHWGFLLKTAIPLLPHQLSSLVISGFDKLFIGYSLGKIAAGKYSIAYSCGMAVSTVAIGASQALSPWIMRKVRAGQTEKAGNVTLISVKLLTPLVIIAMALTPEILSFLAPESYGDSALSVYPIALSSIPIFISTLNSCAITSGDKHKLLVICTGAGAIVNIVANLILTPRLGITAAAYITLTSYTLSTAIGSLLVRRVLGKSLFFANNTLLCFVTCALCASIIMLLESYLLPRFLIAAAAFSFALYVILKNKRLICEA